MNSRLNGKSKYILVVIIWSFLWILRIVNLDADVQGYDISCYLPLDEGYYAMDAIKITRPDLTLKQQIVDTTGIVQWDSAVSCLTTIFCTISFFLFGNNYYGLRMSVFFVGTIIAALIYIILHKEKADDVSKCAVLGSMLTSYAFLQACRVVEPSIIRSLCVIILLYVFYINNQKGRNGYFALGICTAMSIALGYPTNLFIIAACGCLMIYEVICLQGNFGRLLFRYVCGGISGYIASEILCVAIQGRFFIEDFIRVVLKKEVSRIGISLGSIKCGIFEYVRANCFMYCPILAVLSIMALLYCLYSGWVKKERFRMITALMFFFHFLQSIVTNDFTNRKSITIFPVILLNIFFMIKERDEVKSLVGSWPKRVRIISSFLVLIVTVLVFALTTMRILRIESLDLPEGYKYAILVFNVISMLLGLLYFWFQKCRNSKYLVVVLLIVSWIPGMLLSYRAIGMMNKTEKETMIELNELVGENYVLGGFPYSACLYNEIIPLSSVYDAYLGDPYKIRAQMLLENESVNYYLGYQSVELIDSWLEGTEYKWVLVEELETDFRFSDRDADCNNLFLYKKVKK